MKNRSTALLVFVFMLFSSFSSCEKEEIIKPINTSSTRNYLFISHTRTDSNPKMDSIIEKVDYKKFDMLWLGGDLANLTSLDDFTMSHIDSIFDIGNENTLWALGNHDYSDLKRVQAFTFRQSFYSFFKNGITFIVFDTQDNFSSILGQQKELFDSVLDTIQLSSHLVILHHKLLWMYNNPSLYPQISSVSNGEFGECFYCLNENNFYTDIYPKLLEVSKKGIQVICIGGDIGIKVKEFEFTTPEGIHFLASGISAGAIDNKGLVFFHDITNKKITWEFRLIYDL